MITVASAFFIHLLPYFCYNFKERKYNVCSLYWCFKKSLQIREGKWHEAVLSSHSQLTYILHNLNYSTLYDYTRDQYHPGRLHSLEILKYQVISIYFKYQVLCSRKKSNHNRERIIKIVLLVSLLAISQHGFLVLPSAVACQESCPSGQPHTV